MVQESRRKGQFRLPEVTPGEWKGEIVGNASANLGQIVQAGPPRRSVEFSYVILPALLALPGGASFQWPGTVMVMAPTPLKEVSVDAGSLIRNGETPSLTLALDVTRAQFSDLLRLLEARRLRTFYFAVEAQSEIDLHSWPVRSWGMSVDLTPSRPN